MYLSIYTFSYLIIHLFIYFLFDYLFFLEQSKWLEKCGIMCFLKMLLCPTQTSR